jgi:hypothetical protein
VSWFANKVLNLKSTVPDANAHSFPWRDPGPPLKVLMPHAAGLSSYEVRTFADAAKASAYLDNRLRGHIEPGVVAFWALGWEPEELTCGKAEPVVLINDATRKGVAFSLSFVDLDSAMNFLREEYARGLDLACVEVFWAAPLTIELSDGQFRLSPETPPGRAFPFAELKESLDGEFGGPWPTGWAFKASEAAAEPVAATQPTVDINQTYNQPAAEVTGAQYYADLLSDIERHLDLAAERSDASAAEEAMADAAPEDDEPSGQPETAGEAFAEDVPFDDVDLSFLGDAADDAATYDDWPAVADEPSTEVSEPGQADLKVNELINEMNDLLAQTAPEAGPEAGHDDSATQASAGDTSGDSWSFPGFRSHRSAKDGPDSTLDDAMDDLIRVIREDQPSTGLRRPDPLSRDGVARPIRTESRTATGKKPKAAKQARAPKQSKAKAEPKKNDRNVPLVFQRNGMEERFTSPGDEAAPQATSAQPQTETPFSWAEFPEYVSPPEPEGQAPWARTPNGNGLTEPEAPIELPVAAPRQPRPDPLSRQGVTRPMGTEPAAQTTVTPSEQDTLDALAADHNAITHAAEHAASPQATLPARPADETVDEFSAYVAQIKRELEKFRETSRFEKHDEDFDGFDSPPGRF